MTRKQDRYNSHSSKMLLQHYCSDQRQAHQEQSPSTPGIQGRLRIVFDKGATLPQGPASKLLRSILEGSHDIARTKAYKVSCRNRKKEQMPFAHLS